MFKRIKRELSCLGGIKTRLIILVVAAAALGVLTWVTCGNVTVFRRLLRFPPFSAPVPAAFFIWLILYALFGALVALTLGVGKCACDPWLYAVAGYFLALFWCPLFFGGRFFVALAALLLSFGAVVLTAVRAGRYSALIFLLCAVLTAAEAYFVYVTAGTAILN